MTRLLSITLISAAAVIASTTTSTAQRSTGSTVQRRTGEHRYEESIYSAGGAGSPVRLTGKLHPYA